MNREIKFRAYIEKSETQNKAWMIPDFLDYCTAYKNPTAVLNDPKYKVMQYTGLKDKNGKEIYEGDIVKNKYRTFKVEWQDDTSFQPFGGYDVFPNKVEIIGNIYENADLIN